MLGSQFDLTKIFLTQNLVDTSDSLAFPGEKYRMSEDVNVVKSASIPTFLEDKALFLEVWDLRDGKMTDEQVLMAVSLGQL